MIGCRAWRGETGGGGWLSNFISYEILEIFFVVRFEVGYVAAAGVVENNKKEGPVTLNFFMHIIGGRVLCYWGALTDIFEVLLTAVVPLMLLPWYMLRFFCRRKTWMSLLIMMMVLDATYYDATNHRQQ